MNNVVRHILSLLVALPIAFAHTSALAGEPLARIFSAEGEAAISRSDKSGSINATSGLELHAGDIIQVSSNGRVALEFTDGAFIRLGNNARLRLEPAKDGDLNLGLIAGKAHLLSRDPLKHPSINTPTVTAALRGTEFIIEASERQTEIVVIEGALQASNKHGAVTLGANEGCIAKLGEAPSKLLTIDLKDSVLWAVHIPTYTDFSDLYAKEDPTLVEIDEAVNLFEEGQYNYEGHSNLIQLIRSIYNGTARDIVSTIKKSRIAGTRDLILISRVLLLNNRIDDSKKVLELAKQSANDSEHKMALLSTMALVDLSLGKYQEAQRALNSLDGVSSPNTALTRALIQQAGRDLSGAEDTLLLALKNFGEDPRILLRLAELSFSRGDTSQADSYLDLSESKSSASNESGLLRGFIDLADAKPERALERFNLAKVKSGDPQAFFGAALAQIAIGDRHSGERDMLKAVHLDPQSSIYRSYLGKLFYHNHKTSLAEREFDEAIARDVDDPTPWLYRSYLRREQNRPIEALQDIEQSIRKNDNRAVYRSANLLDRDNATRGVSLANVFNDLGFKEIGRIEALKSINSDYTNGASHKFLSETQDEIFSADAALSERRISDLLSPLTLDSLESIATSASFNEYSSLFNHNESRLSLATGFDSRADLYTAEGLYATLSNNYGAALSLSSDLGGGTKHGDSLRDYRLSGTTHLVPDENNKIVLTGRSQFREEDFNSAEDQEVDFRAGGASVAWVGDISEEIKAIFQSTYDRSGEYAKGYGLVDSIYSTQVFEQTVDTLDSEILFDRDRESFVTTAKQELQFIWDNENATTILTGSITNQDVDRFSDSFVIEDSLGELAGNDVHLRTSARNDLSSSSASLYSTAHLMSWLHFTGGLSFDRVEFARTEIPPYTSDSASENEVNPKFGLLVELPENFTFRSSYTEGLLKSSVEDQFSIEPTSVGGITQRFNDLPATSSRNVGVGLDWKIPGHTYIGGEIISRRLSEPYTLATSEFTVDFDSGETFDSVTIDEFGENHIKQRLIRGYVYNILSNHLVSSFDYRYAKQDLLDEALVGFTDDQRLSHTFRYFINNGTFFFNKASWRYQERSGAASSDSGKDIVWLFDLGVGYRLPERGGIISLEALNVLGESFSLDQSSGFDELIESGPAVLLRARFNL